MNINEYDILVVGCGITGSVIARELATQGCKVLMLDRRKHIGGNMYDCIDAHGILIHKYGPHIFHTSDKMLYEYMCNFGEWRKFKLTCGAMIKGSFTPTPFNYKTIDTFYDEAEATSLKADLKSYFGGKEFATILEILNSNNKRIREYGDFLFSCDYRPYTAKQWGIEPDKVEPSILKRVPIRFSYEEGYFDDYFQMMPKNSFTDWFNNILNDKSITIKLGVEATKHISIKDEKLLFDDEVITLPVVYTGALDELFKCCLGELPYRALRFEWHFENKDSKQPYPVTAYPEEKYTRITEYKKLTGQVVDGTSYAMEYSIAYKSGAGEEPCYPVLTAESQYKAESYKVLAEKIPNLYPCGRLADFKYYNMDQALSRALEVKEIIAL